MALQGEEPKTFDQLALCLFPRRGPSASANLLVFMWKFIEVDEGAWERAFVRHGLLVEA